MPNRANHQEIVRKFLDSKAVDFAAVGKIVAELGPSLSTIDEPWESICGTMRNFVRVHIISGGGAGKQLEDLASLRDVVGELKR